MSHTSYIYLMCSCMLVVYYYNSHIPQDQADLLISILDQNKSDTLDLESFLNFGTVSIPC